MFTTSPDGVALWWEASGVGEPVLLVPGRGDSTDIFPERFVAAIVEQGCRVIRYDPRDTGLSGDGGETSTLVGMADDADAVLIAAGEPTAHLVGLSMGGLIVADLASRESSRVTSATFLSAMSPAPDAGIGEDFLAPLDVDPFDARMRAMGPATEEDREWLARELARGAARAPARPHAAERHQEAAFRLGWPEPGRLASIRVPALVIHGDGDRVLPLGHAQAYAEGIPQSDLVVLRGMGHLPRPDEWDEIAARAVRHVLAAPGP